MSQARQSLLWSEAGRQQDGPIAEIALLTPVDRTYSYAVPPELESLLAPGRRVEVPVGRKGRPQIGFCLAVDRGEWSTTLKPLLNVLDPVSLLDPVLLDLGRWLSNYYLCPLGRTLAAMVPEAVKNRSGFRKIKYVRLTSAKSPADSHRKLSKHQESVIAFLTASGDAQPVADVAGECGVSAAVVNGLIKRGVLTIEHRRIPDPAPDFDLPQVMPDYELNEAQRAAMERMGPWIDPPVFRVGLLFGVAGSGKTEVYVQAIQRCLDAGRQAIVLVPEIALTTQTAPRLAQRFTDVAVLHSGLKGRARSLIWNEIAKGRKRLIIGTRSAVFAPCSHLGLIVVDEEQEASFKNQQAPRYHARDVAIKRAQLQSVPVLMGSATPSLETWANVQRFEHFELLRLPERVAGLAMPETHLVDMRKEVRERRGAHLLSRLMEEKLGEALERREQAVLLLNRRGFATFLFCPNCRQRVACPKCGVGMVYHKPAEQAMCHYCNTRVAVPDRCPDLHCRGKLARFGMGTQRIEDELHAKFPQARVQRVDSDTMKQAENYHTVIARFEAREIDLLIGTQMIAKGLDFPFVSFVGVISTDTSLELPDFRAGERTFQLVTQVAGRAGRSTLTGTGGGQVVLQSFATEMKAIQAAVRQDYESFATEELETRRHLGLPPHTRLIRILLEDARESRLRPEAAALASGIRQAADESWPGVRVGPPMDCPIRRMRGLYRCQILITLESTADRTGLTRVLRSRKLLTARVKRLTVDCDPTSTL